MERATGTCMYTHVCINTDAPVWMFRLVYIYSYVSQVHPTLGIKAPPRCTSSFSPFLSAPLTPSFTPFITRPSPALSLSLSPPLFSTSRPSFLCPTRGWIANAADRHWTCIKLSGRSQCQGSSAFLSTDSEGKRPVVCSREREGEGRTNGGRRRRRKSCDPVNSWVYVTCYGHGSVVRWLDEGGWTYNVYRGKDDRAEPHTASLTSVCKHNHHGIPPAVLDLLANSTVSLSLAPRTEWKIQRLNGKTFYHLWISAFGKLSKFLHFYKNEYPFLILF